MSVFFANFLQNIPPERIILKNSSYQNQILFPNCLSQSEEVQNLNYYNNKSYIPLLKLGKQSDSFITSFNSLVARVTKMPAPYKSALSYLVSEFTDNAMEHSTTQNPIVGFQYYKASKVIDICIGDNGIGILNSFLNYSGDKDYRHVVDDLTAIEEVFKGGSTKNSPLRGFGIRTSRKLLVNGINGKFFLISGNALVYNYEQITLESTFPGVHAVFRIPIDNYNNELNIHSYIS